MTQLFPDMPIPPIPPMNGQKPALPLGGTSGVMPGLDIMLNNALQNYNPGDIGICEFEPKIQLTLPLDEWQWWPWYFQPAAITLAAGLAGDQVQFTVPVGMRYWLESLSVTMDSGDNDIDYLIVNNADGYYEAAQQMMLVRPVTNSQTYVGWPEAKDGPTSNISMPGPILLAAGSEIGFRSGGVGASSSNFTYRQFGRLSRMVRAPDAT